MSKPQKALYVLNGFNQGGAEVGLVTLLEHGFMQGADFHIFAFFRGHEKLFGQVEHLVGRDKIHLVSMGDKLTAATLIKGFGALVRLLWAYGPSAVILSLKQANIVGRAALCLFPFVRCIAFEHNTRLDEKKSPWAYRALLGFLSFRVNEVWADCQTTLDETEAFYFWKRKRTKRIVPLFCCSPHVTVKTSYASHDPFRLVMAGRVIPRKRHDLVLHAMRDLVREGKDVSLTVFGTGPHEESLRALAHERGLDHRVVFMGYVENWWQKAADYDVFVHPSDYEGFCIVAAEAMMIGLPVLATALGGLRDYSKDGVDALHLAESSQTAVSQGLSTLYNDEALRARLGQAAAQNMASRFSEASVRYALADITRQLG